MRVAITGASGLIGTALVEELRRHGHEVQRLVRGEPRTPAPDEVRWKPDAGYVDLDRLEGVDGVVHLAGAGIGDRPWTAAHRRRVLDSRVTGTGTIATALTQLERPPSVLVSQSGIHYYGDTGAREVDETSPRGDGFLPSVCVAWEAAAEPARAAGIRVVHPRTGLVMTRRGGLLPRLLLPFRLGLGARLGDGRQYMPPISLADEVRAVRFLLEHDEISGPVNLVVPHAVTNAEFTTMLARIVSRPAVLRVPKLPLRVADKLLANQLTELLLYSLRARPQRLLEAGFAYEHPDVDDVLRWAVKN